jgi:hypothetical protein
LTATFGLRRAVYQVRVLCGPGTEGNTKHYISSCTPLIGSLWTFKFIHYPGICLEALKKPYLTSVIIPCLLGWDLVLGYSRTVKWAIHCVDQGDRRTGNHVISCCTWKLTKKLFFSPFSHNHFEHLYSFYSHWSPKHSRENLLLCQKGVCSVGIKVFNGLSQSIKNRSDNHKQFKLALKYYLYAHSFYPVEEYLNVSREK